MGCGASTEAPPAAEAKPEPAAPPPPAAPSGGDSAETQKAGAEAIASSKIDLVAIFKNFDTSGNGFLSMGELQRAFRAIGLEKRKGEKFELDQKTFKSFDTNDDNKISLNEFAANLHPKTRAKLEEKVLGGWVFDPKAWSDSQTRHAKWDMSKVFKQFDSDGDGKLSMEEFQRGFRALGLKMRSGEKIEVDKAMFASFDTNGDGVVTLSEFEANLHEKTRKKLEQKLDSGWKFDPAEWAKEDDGGAYAAAAAAPPPEPPAEAPAEPAAEAPSEPAAAAPSGPFAFESGLPDCCAASPDLYKMIAELPGVARLVEMTFPPGAKDLPHEHPVHNMYFIVDCKLKISGPPTPTVLGDEGAVAEVPAGAAPIFPAMAHQVENVGESDGHAIFVEAYPGCKPCGDIDGYISPFDVSPGCYKILEQDDNWITGILTMEVGEKDEFHHHKDHLIYVLEGDGVTINPGGDESAAMVVPLKPGAGIPAPMAAPPFASHTLINSGTVPLKMVFFEAKK